MKKLLYLFGLILSLGLTSSYADQCYDRAGPICKNSTEIKNLCKSNNQVFSSRTFTGEPGDYRFCMICCK